MESVKKIAVIGRAFSSKSFEPVFEFLDEGASEGLVEYTTIDVDKKLPSMLEYDGFVYLATTPKETTKPYVKVKASDSEETIVDMLNEFAVQLLSNANEVLPSGDYDSLNGIIISFNNKDIKLSKSDAEELKDILNICKDFNFKVKEVIVNEDR